METYNKHIPGLDQVDSVLKRNLHSEFAGVQKPLNYIREASGKLIRPSLVLLSASLFAGEEKPLYCETDKPVEVAAAVELIHTASLIHDDIIDDAGIRRGKPSLHMVLGKNKAVKIGNFLLSKAFLLLQNNDYNNDIVNLFNKSVSLMCEGEAEQLERSFDFNLTEEDYYHFNYKKTSHFLAVCCQAGAMSAGIKNNTYLKSLEEYGKNLGYAFQIIDDILDFTASPRDLGKPVGNDFKQGTVTLPLIFILQNKNLRRVVTLIEDKDPASFFTTLKKIAIENGAIKYSLMHAYRAKNNAYSALKNLPSSVYRDHLKAVLDKLTEKADPSLLTEV